jgi:hypothetical protein
VNEVLRLIHLNLRESGWLESSPSAPYHASPDSEDILCRRKLIASLYLHRAVASDNLLNGMLLIIQTLDMCSVSFIGSRVLYVILKIKYSSLYNLQMATFVDAAYRSSD